MSLALQWHRRRRGAPSAPAAPTATSRGLTSITVSWSTVSGASGYVVQRSTDQVTWTALPAQTTTSLTDSSLTAATAYFYRVAATSASGTSAYSPVLSTSTTATAAPPSAPTTAPTVVDVGSTTMSLAWTAVTGATSYILERATTETGTYTSVYSGTELTADLTGLTAATTYWFRYKAVNSDGTSGASPTKSQATTAATGGAPATPSAPTATASTATTITVTWTAVTGATSYTLQRSTTSGGTYATVYTGGATSFSDSGRTASTTYYYKLSASNTAGTSSYSAAASAVTLAAGSTTVQPVSARFVRRHAGFRVAPHENGATSVYKGANADEICRIAADIGLTYVRGMFPGAKGGGLPEWVAALKKYNLKWLMTLIPEAGTKPTDQTVAETQAKVRSIRDDADLAAICLGLEGINEPNHNKGGGTVPSDWATTCYNHQKAIWDIVHPPDGSTTSLSGVLVLGPSLQATMASESYRGTGPWVGGPRHYHQVVDAGCLDYMDIGGLHTYPNGTVPEQGLDFRLENMRGAYGANYPVFVSEWGYSNAVNSTAGVPVTPEVAGIYAPRGFLEYIIGVAGHNGPRDPLYMTWYEAMDNWNPGKTDREAWFGAIGTKQATTSATLTAADAQALAADSANFYAKPVAVSLKALLDPMKDPVTTAAYTPTQVTLDISTTATDLIWWCVANKAQSDLGTASVYLVRNSVYNAVAKGVTVTDRKGKHATTYQVGGEVVKVDLR